MCTFARRGARRAGPEVFCGFRARLFEPWRTGIVDDNNCEIKKKTM